MLFRSTLHTHLRCAQKQLRKRYGAYDSRGRLAGKRPITARPAGATNRSSIGHWEIDTVMGNSQGGACILTLVERVTGFLLIGKLERRATAELNARLIALIQRETRPVRTITADNGTEFHSYKIVEQQLPVRFYFAAPHHSWERGSNENTNGLIRQYLPKGVSMDALTQAACDRIAAKLNRSGSAFLYSETGCDNWIGGRGYAAAASGHGVKYASSGVRSARLECGRRVL